MGLIQAAKETVSKMLGDQWREYFYCDSLSENVLAVKGQKRVSAGSSNKNGAENIISNGSIVAVNEGQAMMIVQQGAVVEFSAEAGEFVWDSSTEPSIFYGKLGDNLKGSWEVLKKRFSMGGDPGVDQRVYFFNTKEIIGNKYGTANPVPFRVVDTNIGLDMDIAIKCFGEYSYKLSDPMLFYKNVCGNVVRNYTRDQIDSQLKTEFLTALQPAFAEISEKGIRYSALPGHTDDLAEALNNVLSEKWNELRGISVVSVGVSSVKASEEDEATIKELQKTAVYRNPNMAGAAMVGAQAEAMKSAAANENGAMMGFMGLGMAQQAGGMNANNLFQMGQQQQYQQQPSQYQYQQPGQASATPVAAPAAAPAADKWVCECGAENTGKFCVNCGKGKPAPAPVSEDGWVCSCGAKNTGKFCMECGAKKPEEAPSYKCSKCGFVPADPKNPPKFCPNCGKLFGDEDIVR